MPEAMLEASREEQRVTPGATKQRDVTQHPSAEQQPEDHSLEVLALVRIAVVGIAALASWFRVWEPFPRLDVIGLLGTLMGGYPIFREALGGHSVATDELITRGKPRSFLWRLRSDSPTSLREAD